MSCEFQASQGYIARHRLKQETAPLHSPPHPNTHTNHTHQTLSEITLVSLSSLPSSPAGSQFFLLHKLEWTTTDLTRASLGPRSATSGYSLFSLGSEAGCSGSLWPRELQARVRPEEGARLPRRGSDPEEAPGLVSVSGRPGGGARLGPLQPGCCHRGPHLAGWWAGERLCPAKRPQPRPSLRSEPGGLGGAQW